ncbi:hypothetical protein EFK50_08500 [Nocardioides marmoriginsengisoli]|uniref:Uncharacterized protein n=1 Tax=Nocardioides marmoriginsengisoli TaxID=661483 RepID=A0A3N0CK97_9ACTN|nr:hypothetical protein [Nocardioides marmoriginsengisoli]RNL63759.1 hypothetical protein EFK50_08500 [Nocardioides marmoriginsengisoli]
MPDTMPDEGADQRGRIVDGLPPGPERRRALRRAGLSFALADFSEQEQHERWGSRSTRRRPARKQDDP